MKKIIKFIESRNSGKIVLALFVITNVVYAYMLMVTIPNTMEFSEEMKLLDMMPTGYDLNYVVELFKSLGESGRQYYLTNQIPVDMFYPLCFAISYCLMLAYFLKKLNKLNTTLGYLCFLPVVAGVADYLENFGIIKLLNSYPNVTDIVVTTTNLSSIIKSTSTTLSLVTLIIILITLGVKSVWKR